MMAILGNKVRPALNRYNYFRAKRGEEDRSRDDGNSVGRISTLGRGRGLPARRIEHYDPLNLQVIPTHSQVRFKPAATGACFMAILKQQAKQKQVPMGLKEALMMYPASKNKSIINNSALIGEGILNQFGSLVPKLMPPLLIGFFLWDQSVVADIHKCLADYTLGTLNSIEHIKAGLDNMAPPDADLPIGYNKLSQDIIDTAQKAKEEIERQAKAALPEDSSPNNIAKWVAGVILAAAIAYISGGSRDDH